MIKRANARIAENFLNLLQIRAGIDESFITHMGECMEKNDFTGALIMEQST